MPITAIPVYTSRDHNEGWSTLMPSGGGGGGWITEGGGEGWITEGGGEGKIRSIVQHWHSE